MSYHGQFKNSRWNSSPRPAETYRGNRPAKATGRGKLKRELLRRERLEEIERNKKTFELMVSTAIKETLALASAKARDQLQIELRKTAVFELAEAEAFVENIQTSFAIGAEIPLRYTGCKSADEYEVIANNDTYIGCQEIVNDRFVSVEHDEAHNAEQDRLAKRRERDRAKRAELKKQKLDQSNALASRGIR